jgi:Tfp pilus assembly protein PilZ
MTPAPARRRDKRYVLSLPVLITLAKKRIEAETADLGHGGMFVVTDAELALGQLIKVELLLPPRSETFEAPAKLVYLLPAIAKDTRRGVGVQFYGLGRGVQDRWDAFIDHVRRTYPTTEERVATPQSAEPVHVDFKRSDAQVGALRVQVRSVNDLVRMQRRDLSRGTIFFATPGKAYAGDELALQIVHPLNGDVFEMQGKVRRVVDDAGIKGLELELVACDDDRRARFEDFIYDGMAELFDDEEIENPGRE